MGQCRSRELRLTCQVVRRARYEACNVARTGSLICSVHSLLWLGLSAVGDGPRSAQRAQGRFFHNPWWTASITDIFVCIFLWKDKDDTNITAAVLLYMQTVVSLSSTGQLFEKELSELGVVGLFAFLCRYIPSSWHSATLWVCNYVKRHYNNSLRITPRLFHGYLTRSKYTKSVLRSSHWNFRISYNTTYNGSLWHRSKK